MCCCPFLGTISEETCQPRAWDADLWEAGGPAGHARLPSQLHLMPISLPRLLLASGPLQFLECDFLHAVPTAWDPFCPLPGL